ncbi:MAG: type IV secretion protein DotH [Alphaproteobacteria bacterium]|nr:type IV secretion protein DotH [Alphaproteobacteria bacterium]
MNKILKNTVLGLGASAFLTCLSPCGSFAQALPDEAEQTVQDSPARGSALPAPPGDEFSFDDTVFDFEQKGGGDPDEIARKEAFEAALQGLLPLRPNEIRTLLERFDRTQESVTLPVYPAPEPESVVENISLDPGAKPPVVKLSYGHVTTISFMDSSGAPWPIQNMAWAGNFQIVETKMDGGSDGGKDELLYTHQIIISPQSEFAFGNMSIDLLGLQTPVIIVLETNRDIVHYRFDAIVPEYGPLAEAPIIDTAGSGGGVGAAGGAGLSAVLEGLVPEGAQRLEVAGVDGRTSAFNYNGMTFVRTPLSLLSPGWTASVSSLDGMKVYAINESPVILLSDRGRMVKAHLSSRGDILDE